MGPIVFRSIEHGAATVGNFEIECDDAPVANVRHSIDGFAFDFLVVMSATPAASTPARLSRIERTGSRP